MAIWKHVGFNILIVLAGLQGIPAELENAARLDGAGRHQRQQSHDGQGEGLARWHHRADCGAAGRRARQVRRIRRTRTGARRRADSGDRGPRLHNVYALLYNACVYRARQRQRGQGLVFARAAGLARISQRPPMSTTDARSFLGIKPMEAVS